MNTPAQPAAWIIAKPRGVEMRRARRLFTTVSLAPAGMLRLNVPHLTLELLYPPLPALEELVAALADVARTSMPFQVPTLGVVREVSGTVSVELARSPELIALRRMLAKQLGRIGATLHAGPTTSWRPHLSVIGREELSNKTWARPEPDVAVADYQFTVECLILSLPTRSPSRFREFGPYRLGEANMLTRR